MSDNAASASHFVADVGDSAAEINMATSEAADAQSWVCERINVIALLARAGRKQYRLDSIRAVPYKTLAQQLLERVKLKGHQRLPVTTYRCGACGYLESYAPAA